ncbi:hypothetical protein E2C01_009370 [Portunus trituberculatus]|uniref:Uncharacterized protein n=1 Tax=Portunus trituberculatus TaxID=210409 RepID=A0A5B7D3C6_PORTR|nr:hypothetical protein [Portunus trituberculatus]
MSVPSLPTHFAGHKTIAHKEPNIDSLLFLVTPPVTRKDQTTNEVTSHLSAFLRFDECTSMYLHFHVT